MDAHSKTLPCSEQLPGAEQGGPGVKLSLGWGGAAGRVLGGGKGPVFPPGAGPYRSVLRIMSSSVMP